MSRILKLEMKTVLLIVYLLSVAPINFVVSGINFVTKPENRSFISGQKLFLNCSTNAISSSEIVWMFTPFSRPLSEINIGQLLNESKVPPLSFAVEHPNAFTSNLVFLNPNSSDAGRYCCQYEDGQGKSCAYVKMINIPENEVVLAGRSVMLNCAQDNPFRWYRYLPSNPFNDIIIFFGSRMAYDADERFEVYKKPDDYPFERLDLLVRDVQESHAGTYKCLQSPTARCAEIIVLDSEPLCSVIRVNDDTVQLQCSMKVTSNGRPEMHCTHNSFEPAAVTACSNRNIDGMVICEMHVDMSTLPDISCVIKFRAEPQKYFSSCSHASNQPKYLYRWIPSYLKTEAPFWSTSNKKLLSICLICSVIINIINVAAFTYCFVRQKSCVSGYDRSSTSSCSTEYETDEEDAKLQNSKKSNPEYKERLEMPAPV